MTNLARQLAAHPRWRWEPGMVAQFGLVAGVGGVDGAVILIALPEIGITRAALSEAVPDIHDPATRGWLLHMLREAHKYESLTPQACKFSNRPPERKWDVEVWDETFTAPTEGDALAAALLAVWGAS